ncbi:MAG: hypothetical protein MJA27_25620 [Pseudanabaenales cyanobacterium]|nr:hypothetical protein [Pseudanabaenales cyanobacterium]
MSNSTYILDALSNPVSVSALNVWAKCPLKHWINVRDDHHLVWTHYLLTDLGNECANHVIAIADPVNEYADPVNEYADLENAIADLRNAFADQTIAFADQAIAYADQGNEYAD